MWERRKPGRDASIALARNQKKAPTSFSFFKPQYSNPPSGKSVSEVSLAYTEYHCSISYNFLILLAGYI